MILYFTGTGNSKYVADALADRLEDGVCSLNDVLKGQGQPAYFSEKPFVVVAPVYAWRLPRVIEALLLQSRFSGTRKLYFIATMGAQSGNCGRYCEKICDRMEMEYMGFCGISMPDNFVYASVMADQETIDRTLQAAKPQIAALAQAVLHGERIEKKDKTPVSGLMSGPVNALFYRFFVTSKNFVTSDGCNSCGACVRICPVNNIRLTGGKPQFGDRCIHCYACIHRCHNAAIDIKGKSEQHGRYQCPVYQKEL